MVTKNFPHEEIIPEMKRLVNEGSEVIFVPKGSSMLPFIRGGADRVIMVKAENVAKDDVILALTDQGNYVLHRVEQVDGDNITLMGDGNLYGRERCKRENVVAKAIKIINKNSEIDCRSETHLRKVRLWRQLLPLRRYLLAIYRRLYR